MDDISRAVVLLKSIGWGLYENDADYPASFFIVSKQLKYDVYYTLMPYSNNQNSTLTELMNAMDADQHPIYSVPELTIALDGMIFHKDSVEFQTIKPGVIIKIRYDGLENAVSLISKYDPMIRAKSTVIL